MLQEAVDGSIAAKPLNEGAPGVGILLADFEEWFQELPIRDKVDEGVAGEVPFRPIAPELALVTLKDRG